MAYGILIQNSNQKIQIDNTFFNFYQIRAGNFSVSISSTGNDARFGARVTAWPASSSDILSTPLTSTQIDFTCPYIIPIKLSGSYWYANYGSYYETSPDAWYVTFFGIAGQSFSVPYKVFVSPSTYWRQAEPDYGMVIYDYAEPPDVDPYVRFSNEETYLEIAGVYTGNSPIRSNGTIASYTDFTVEDAVNNYFILTPFGFKHDYVSSNRCDLYCNLMRRINATTVRVQAINTYDWYSSWSASNEWYTDIDTVKLIEIKG